MRYRTHVSEERIGALHFRLTQLVSFESEVDRLFAELSAAGRPEALEALCPYFGVLWPSARVLSRWMTDQPEGAFRHKRVLEIGCGLALPALVAASLGAEVVASDFHPDVPSFLALNQALNGLRVGYRSVDWREAPPSAAYDWILASDVLYDSRDVAPLARFLAQALSPHGRAVILDPDRSHWRSLLEACRHAGLWAQETTLSAQSAGDPASAVLLQLAKKNRID